MAEKIDILQVVNSHLTLHLLAPGEADIPHGDTGEAGDTGKSGDAAGANAACGADQQEGSALNGAEPQPTDEFLPENLVEDFVDEISDMLETEKSRYAKYQRWERPLIIGFLDGVLAVANDTWSELEDLYYESARSADFAELDAEIDRVSQDFEGERPWDEAAKGYARKTIARPGNDPVTFDVPFWTLCSHGFMYGADAAYDLEWKVIVTPARNALLTDEESINEAAMARMNAGTGHGSLIDRVFDMIGIDPNELAAALAAADEAETDADTGPETARQ